MSLQVRRNNVEMMKAFRKPWIERLVKMAPLQPDHRYDNDILMQKSVFPEIDWMLVYHDDLRADHAKLFSVSRKKKITRAGLLR